MPGRTQSSTIGGYKYAHNGQEKDDEIFEGALSAEFWEYDSRLGRRWENDPIVKPWESPYACFANNPVWFSDVKGLDADEKGGKGKDKGGDKKNYGGKCKCKKCGTKKKQDDGKSNDKKGEKSGDKKPTEKRKEKKNLTLNFFYSGFSQESNHINDYKSNKKAETDNYKVFEVNSIKEALDIMLKLKETSNIHNVYFSTHGHDKSWDGGGMTFPAEKNGVYLYGAKAIFEAKKIFQNIGNAMDKDGNIVLLSCGGGETNKSGFSVIGAIAKYSKKTTYGNRGYTMIYKIPTESIQATYGTIDKWHEDNFPNMIANAGEWKKAKPALNSPNGFVLKTIPSPIISPNGIKIAPYNWKTKNKKISIKP